MIPAKSTLPPLIFIFVLLCANLAVADSVNVWLTQLQHGVQKEQLFDAFNDNRQYNLSQDTHYDLYKKQPPIALANAPSESPCRIVVDKSKTYQDIEGLGAAMTDSSAWLLANLKKQNPALYRQTMQMLFSHTTGAGFSYLRRPIGSSDYTATAGNYTYCDEESEDLSKFSIAHDREYIIPVLRDALKINPEIKIMGSPWSPPAWMKTNNSLFGLTKKEKAEGKENKLVPKYYDLFAEYLTRFILAYEKEGIPIHTITLQNEPHHDRAKYPCMRMTSEEQIIIIRLLGKKFQKHGIKTKVAVFDHNWVLHRDDMEVVGGDKKQVPLEYVSKLLSDPKLSPFIAASAWHCYAGNYGDMVNTYRTIQKRFPTVPIYTTEASAWRDDRQKPGDRFFYDTDWALRNNWIGTIQNGASLSLQWNIALDHNFGPTLRDDSLAIGLVTVRSDKYAEVKFEREFYGMAQVSKAARPGSKRIDSTLHTDNKESKEMLVLAFNLSNGSTSLVVYNANNNAHTFDVECAGKFFNYKIPAKSIATFIW